MKSPPICLDENLTAEQAIELISWIIQSAKRDGCLPSGIQTENLTTLNGEAVENPFANKFQVLYEPHP